MEKNLNTTMTGENVYAQVMDYAERNGMSLPALMRRFGVMSSSSTFVKKLKEGRCENERLSQAVFGEIISPQAEEIKEKESVSSRKVNLRPKKTEMTYNEQLEKRKGKDEVFNCKINMLSKIRGITIPDMELRMTHRNKKYLGNRLAEIFQCDREYLYELPLAPYEDFSKATRFTLDDVEVICEKFKIKPYQLFAKC